MGTTGVEAKRVREDLVAGRGSGSASSRSSTGSASATSCATRTTSTTASTTTTTAPTSATTTGTSGTAASGGNRIPSGIGVDDFLGVRIGFADEVLQDLINRSEVSRSELGRSGCTAATTTATTTSATSTTAATTGWGCCRRRGRRRGRRRSVLSERQRASSQQAGCDSCDNFLGIFHGFIKHGKAKHYTHRRKERVANIFMACPSGGRPVRGNVS